MNTVYSMLSELIHQTIKQQAGIVIFAVSFSIFLLHIHSNNCYGKMKRDSYKRLVLKGREEKRGK